MKSRIFNNIFILIVIAELMIAGGTVIYRDPFFHYHKPYRDDWHLDFLNMIQSFWGLPCVITFVQAW